MLLFNTFHAFGCSDNAVAAVFIVCKRGGLLLPFCGVLCVHSFSNSITAACAFVAVFFCFAANRGCSAEKSIALGCAFSVGANSWFWAANIELHERFFFQCLSQDSFFVPLLI